MSDNEVPTSFGVCSGHDAVVATIGTAFMFVFGAISIGLFTWGRTEDTAIFAAVLGGGVYMLLITYAIVMLCVKSDTLYMRQKVFAVTGLVLSLVSVIAMLIVGSVASGPYWSYVFGAGVGASVYAYTVLTYYKIRATHQAAPVARPLVTSPASAPAKSITA